ncbi:MAG: methyltransferase domain-containing protein, partial [Actinobacteria bacterium]
MKRAMYQTVTVDDGDRTRGHASPYARCDSAGFLHCVRVYPRDTTRKWLERRRPMGFFTWAAPMFGKFADRWSPDRIDEIAGWLRPYLPEGGKLLDVGGGTGALAVKLNEALGADVTVLDPTKEMLGYIPDFKPVHAVLGTAEKMPFPDDSFDAVVVTDA